MHVEFDARAPAGHRVWRLLVGNQDVADNRVYRIAAREREGDATDTLCRIPQAKNARLFDRELHEVIRSYLAKTPDAGLMTNARVVAAGLPERVFSQYYRR